MQPGSIPPPNPLNAAASQAMHAARETRSPLLEKLAIGTMILSAVVSTGLGVLQVARMIKHDRDEEDERLAKAEERALRRLRSELDARERAASQGRGR
jgi:hypothetical protein